MRYAIFSDVHANIEAFDEVVRFYKRESIDKYIFLGDIVGYGADPCAAISALRALKAVSVAGNHDWAVAGLLALERFNPDAQHALAWTQQQLSAEETHCLKQFPLTYWDDEVVCTHASLDEPGDFNYIKNISDARKNFLLFEQKILFVGHSHTMQAYSFFDQATLFLSETNITIDPRARYIVNVASVGQPRDRDRRLCCCIYDSDQKMVILKRLEYNISQAAAKIMQYGLPQSLAARLYLGW